MKKFAIIFLLISMLFNIPVSANNSEKHHSGFGSEIPVSDIGTVCFINNSFYQIYKDELFNEYYTQYLNSFSRWVKYSEYYESGADFSDGYAAYKMYSDSKGNKKANYSYITAVMNNNDVFYCTVVFEYEDDCSEEINIQLANNLYDNVDILYAGSDTPCVVLKINGGNEEISAIIENEYVVYVSAAFDLCFDMYYSEDIYTVEFNPTAKDARYILRYAAKLENLPERRYKAKEFLISSDSDFDGKITSADARTALRIAAKLENGRTYGGGTSSIWSC